MENKKCFKCGERLPLTEFYTHKGMKDGHLSKCKSCTKKDVADRTELKSKDPEWVFNERERHRLRSIRHRAEGKVYRGNKKQLDASDPKKRATIASASISAPDGSQRHHWSYKEEHWKDVIILPRAEHYKVHRYTIYDKEHLQYRTVHGVLLDSRELAEKYYAIVLTIEDGIYSELQKLF
tara:strand:+ start:120 stop:659 length:540 start_codon:yes stop_codon:yes gene_type:complete